MIATVTSVIWNKDTTPSDLNKKHQIFGVVGMDYSVAESDHLSDMSDGGCSSPTTFCTLIDIFGSLVFHQDFANANNGYLNGKSVNDMFLGVREPDLADALIARNLLQLQPRQKSPDSKVFTSMYRVNEKMIQDLGGMATGTLVTTLKCLERTSPSAPLPKWYLSLVKRSNTAILVVEGYKRKSTPCTFETTAEPVSTNIIHRCPATTNSIRTMASDKKLHFPCSRCAAGSFGGGVAVAFVIGSVALNGGSEEAAEKCRKCPTGWIASSKGMRACTICERGKVPNPASNYCAACLLGQTSDETSAGACSDCPAGWYAKPKLSVTTTAYLEEPSYCEECECACFFFLLIVYDDC
jgi:hypothetical protein